MALLSLIVGLARTAVKEFCRQNKVEHRHIEAKTGYFSLTGKVNLPILL
jgi:hypothetical protein